MRYFNTSGSCIEADHYMLPPERRLGECLDLIDKKAYFVLHDGVGAGGDVAPGVKEDARSAMLRPGRAPAPTVGRGTIVMVLSKPS